ncbi:MAG: DEAD/DEAH box helicase [Streptosporangiales bacterium]|nr:DEAD/DEAH box helicase [Streptosporangiales bacterium]
MTGPVTDAGAAFAACAFGGAFRVHQDEALAAFEKTRAAGADRWYFVLPPGAGKTLLGLEAARRLGRRTVVFGPNTAIQAQWLEAWEGFRPATVTAGTDRELSGPLTVLTYQSLAVFDPDAEVDEEGRARRSEVSQLDRLHDNGRALVERLRAGGPWTLVLDECHHLLEVWGHLIAELVAYLAEAGVDVAVVGLTATPRAAMSERQSALVAELFGPARGGAGRKGRARKGPGRKAAAADGGAGAGGAPVTYAVSTPAVVRTGHIAPYQELAYLTPPSAAEAGYLREEAVRFAELRADLLDPGFARVPFLEWADRALTTDWARLEREDPELAVAALRLHHAGLLALPAGARPGERHRRAPTADDWARLIGRYVRDHLSGDDPRDREAYEAIRTALPAVGYRLTRRGVQRAQSPVDRVLARSEAKTTAAVAILGTEHAALGDRIRALVVCDHERAASRPSARLTGVLPDEAGSARLLLERLVYFPETAALSPIMMTGSTVACDRETGERLLTWAAAHGEPGLRLAPLDETADPDGLVAVTGSWTARRWVRLVTAFFTEGHAKVLVGTRGLLGEGWNAERVNVVVDLTTATTPTAVVQTRGRGLRLDPDWPEKVSDTWSVTVVDHDHPRGSADYERLVLKHAGFLAVDDAGDVMSGVAHVDAELSPYGPPPAADLDTFNARMLERARDREKAREQWRVGEPYADRTARILRVHADHDPAEPGPALAALIPERRWRRGAPDKVRLREYSPLTPRILLIFAAWMFGTSALYVLPAFGPVAGLATMAACLLLPAVTFAVRAWHRAWRVVWAPRRSLLGRAAAAVAETLAAEEPAVPGPEAVRHETRPGGVHRMYLDGVPEPLSERFATALEEALTPVPAPRYLVSRTVLDPGPRRRWPLRAAAALALRRILRRPLPAAWHAVPAEFGRNRKLAERYAAAWERHVGPTRLVFAGGPEAAALTAGAKDDDTPATIHTAQLRTLWR